MEWSRQREQLQVGEADKREQVPVEWSIERGTGCRKEQTKGNWKRWNGALETGTGDRKEQTNDAGTPGGVEEYRKENTIKERPCKGNRNRYTVAEQQNRNSKRHA